MVRGIAFTNSDVHLQIKEAEILIPTVWLWRRWTQNPATQQPFLRADGWKLEFRSGTNTLGATPSSTYNTASDSTNAIRLVEKWLPRALFNDGTFQIEKTALTFPAVTWDRGNLSGTIALPGYHQEASFIAGLCGVSPYTVQLHSDTLDLQSDIQILFGGGELFLRTTNIWQTNRIELAAQFSRDGWLPQKATLRSTAFSFPASKLQMPDYDRVRGSLEMNWTQGQFAVTAQAEALPLNNGRNPPQARLDFKARGDTNAAIIQSATLSLPCLQAELSKELTVHFAGPFLREPGTFKLAAELDRQAWILLHGTLKGKADLTPGAGRFPRAQFRLEGTNVGVAQLEAKNLAVNGEVQWPAVKIANAEALFDDASLAKADGAFNWETKNISGAHLEFHGPLACRWLPAGFGYENLALSADVAGPLGRLSHQGHLTVTNLSVPQMKPLQFALDWTAEQTDFHSTKVLLSSGNASLEASFAARLNTPDHPENYAEIALHKLTLQDARKPLLELETETTISVASHSTNEWKAAIPAFHWRGPEGGLQLQAEVEWPHAGALRLNVQRANSRLLDLFLKEPLDQFEILKFAGSVAWTNGPALFDLELSAQASGKKAAAGIPRSPVITQKPGDLLQDWGPVSAQLMLSGNANGIGLSNLMVASQTSSVAVARGFLPLTFNPANRTNFVQWDTKRSVALKMATEPNSVFWQKLAEWTGMALTEPGLQADVTGTWADPRGTIHLHALKMQMPKTKSRLPVLEHLDADIALDRQQALLTNFNLLVQGQPVKLSAQIPLGDAFWADLKAKKIPNWESASGRLTIAEAQISAFAQLFPDLLSPQGQFSLNVSLAPGANLDGALSLHGARTRPLPNVGPIRDIAVTLRFSGRTVNLQTATASIGGSAISAIGEGDLSGTDWLKGVAPPFKFNLLGTNVPLSRQPGSIIRSDLNLSVQKTNGGPALISGTARLRDSYYLSDLADLVPGRVSSPQGRPPYFSIEEPALADWGLAVHVTGERGLTVFSSLFKGQATPNLRLQGTLQQPLALGEVKIDSGIVKFPFANLAVQRGYITLTSEDPYRPHLMITAASRKFGYDVRMDVTGPADEPVIQFTSTPPLSSEQLLLMVTAGELPKGGYTLNPQQRAQTMALFLGKDLLSKLGFGDQAEERLSFSSGQDISETGKPTYSLEYKLTDRWSVVGEYDRFNALNAGLKWKIYSR